MNIDISGGSSPLRTSYEEMLASFGCEQLVTEFTRITSSSASLIDHVFTNVRDLISDSGVISVGFSDHLITFCSRKWVKGASATPNTRQVRSMKSYSKASFIAELVRIDWSHILSSSDVNYCLSEFTRLFKLALDHVAPVKEVRVRNKHNPWMNSHILSMIKKRDGLVSSCQKCCTKGDQVG